MSPGTTNHRRDWIALYVLCLGMLMIVLDGTIVNTALPVLKDSLDFSDSNLTWVLNAYLIPFGGLLMLSGRIGDLIGQRRMFLWGMSLFTLASLLCGLAESQEMLIGARFLQGVGGALGSSVILGMIITMFQEPKIQGEAIGVYSFVASAGGSIGLLLGGVLTDILSWHWIFMVNLPIGVATVLLALRLVPDRPGLGLKENKVDVPGALMLTGGLMVGVYAIVGIERHGAGSPQTLGFGALSIALITAFLVRQGRIANPLMPLRLFRSRNVVGANVVMALLVVGMFAMFFLGALYMQQVLGYDALGVGLAFLPSTIVMGAMSLRGAARFTIRFGAKTALITSLVSIMVGLLLFSQTPTDGSYVVDILPAMTFIGFGAGLSFPPLMTLAMSGATPSDSGLASGLINTTVQVGGAIGLAVLATLASERTHGLRADGEVANVALNSGYHLAYLVGAGFAAAAIVFAVVVLRSAPVGDEQAVPAADEPHGAAVEVSQASGDPAGLPAYSEA